MTFIPDHRKSLFLGGLAALVVLASGCVPKAPAPPPPTVIVYGDSLTSQAKPQIDAGLRASRPGWRPIIRAHGGTALCDWFAQMNADGNLNARLVVIQMSGNTLTPCMAGIPGGSPQQVAKYRADAEAAVSIWVARGVPVLFVASPGAYRSMPPIPEMPHPLDVAYADVAMQWAAQGVTFSSATEMALSGPDGSVPKARAIFPFVLPCLPQELGRPECVLDPADSVFKIQVRDGAPPGPGESVTRGHLCPIANAVPCPVYSSGIVRFASAFVAAAVARMP